MKLLPSHIGALVALGVGQYGLRIDGVVSTDTETSGLYADDGARVSTASVAWSDNDGTWERYLLAKRLVDNVTFGEEEIAPGITERIVSVAWPFDQGTEGKPEDTGQMRLWPEAENLGLDEWQALMWVLAEHPLNMHNAKFDLEKYRVGCRRWPGEGKDLLDNIVWDTQNVNAFLWALHPTSLKPTCARLFGKQWADEAGVVKRYLQKSKLPVGRWDLMPWDVIGVYADTDARITHMLRLRQIWEIGQGAGHWVVPDHGPTDVVAREALGLDDNDYVYDAIQRRLETMKVLYRMEKRGLPYDEVMSREAGIECRQRAAQIEPELPFKPTGDAAKEFFFSDKTSAKGKKGLDLIPYSVTDKGAPSLTAEVLTRMVADAVPHADKWAEWNKASNAASMWYEGYADAIGSDGRLRTCFRQNGTRSSRFSVERVNLQAIPQDYRLSDHAILSGIPTPRQIIAHAVELMPGWDLYELDLAQAELRVATDMAGCEKMRSMIANGEDLHSFTTEALFDLSRDHEDFFKWRQVGKRGNFSLCFGSGGATFRAMVSKETGIYLGETEAERIVRDWNALYPEFKRAINKHQYAVEKRQSKHGNGWLSYVNRERRWFQEYEEAHKAFNQRVQGNLGQFGIDWMLRTDEFLRGQGLDKDQAGLVLTIHDSQVLLLPEGDEGAKLAAQCADFGRDLWKETFPGIPGDVDYHSWEYAS